MNYISTLDMPREKWLDLRQTYLGSSEFGAVLGLSKYATPLDIYRRKVGEDDPIEDNLRMKFGRDSEDLLAQWFSEETGLEVHKDNKIRFHPEHKFLATNIDRLILSKNGEGPGYLELKTVSEAAFNSWGNDIPLHYFAQHQGGLEITGWKHGYFYLVVFGFAGIKETHVIKFDRDAEYNDKAIPRLVDFWRMNVEKKIAPPPATDEDLAYLYPQSSPAKALEAAEETLKAVSEINGLKGQIKELNDRKKALSTSVKMAMGDAEVLTAGEEVVATWKSSKPTRRFNKKGFAEDHPALYDKYNEEKAGIRRFITK